MKCLKCQTWNPEIAIYCQQCGTPLATDSKKDYIDALKSGIISLVFTSVGYLLFYQSVNDNYLQQLFGGHISETITGFSFWALFLLWFKYLRYHKQIKAFNVFKQQTMRQMVAQGTYAQHASQTVEAIGKILQETGIHYFQESLIFRRARRILHYIHVIPKKEEVTKIIEYQGEIDFNRMENSYALLNVLIWAIPILGFIGTVFGIGEAIGSFSEFIQAADSVSLGGQMRSALSGVTSGLSTAFNTTFLALLFVIPVMIISSFLHKAEEDLLLFIEEYCLEELLPNLHIHVGGSSASESSDHHLSRLLEFSDTWMAKMSPLLEATTRYAESLRHQISGLQPVLKEFSDEFFQLKDRSPTPPAIEDAKNSSKSLHTAGSSNSSASETVSTHSIPSEKALEPK